MATIKVDSTAMREKSDSFNTIANHIGSYTEQRSQQSLSFLSSKKDLKKRNIRFRIIRNFSARRRMHMITVKIL